MQALILAASVLAIGPYFLAMKLVPGINLLSPRDGIAMLALSLRLANAAVWFARQSHQSTSTFRAHRGRLEAGSPIYL